MTKVLAASATTVLLGPLLGAAGAFVALWLVSLASHPVELWPATPELLLATAAAAASALAVLGLGRVAARVGPRSQAIGGWLVWSLLAVVVAIAMPGASILFIAPALLAGLGLALGGVGLATALGGAMAFALWAPLIPALVDALGFTAWLAGALVGWTWGVAAPCLVRSQPARGPGVFVDGLALLAAAVGLLAARAPRFDVDAPGKLNILHVQDLDTGAARLVLDAPDGVPSELSSGTAWQDTPLAVPWSFRALPVAAAAPEPAEGPSFTRTSDEPRGELRRVTGTLRARPGARALYVIIPAGAVASLQINGRSLDPSALRTAPEDARVVVLYGPPAAGVTLSAELRGDAPWTIADALPGVPETAAALLAARPPERVPYQMGDLRVALRKIDL